MQFNNQISAILWKNMKMTNQGEFVKEFFIPLITITVLVMVEDDGDTTGQLFMTLLVPVYIPSSLVGLSRQLLVEYVHEKSNKYRDLYRIMGMKLSNYRMAWFITYVVKSALICSVLILALFYKLGLMFEIVLCFLLFIAAQTAQTLLLSTFFSNAQLAGEFGSFFQTILSSFYFASMSDYKILVFVCPQSIVSYYMMNKLNKIDDYSIECLLALAAHFIVSFWLYNLIESHEEGFQCKCRKKAKKIVEPADPMETQRQYDEEGLAFISIEIVKLFKQYGDVFAVENLNLKIYSQQILCILGQNGAGKTTTLNILTGLLQRTSGKILYFGKNFDKKRDEIQKLIGFCPQENLLYGELTVQESLQYQGMMRGVDQADAEINNWIEILQLKQFKNYKTCELSGGNKRKLQIALAMMGGSQIIFLDEPTASIDPDSRRQIWTILKEIKKINKTLILTTHFLDEAEELADRIAIMKSGQLKAFGSPDSIKKELEVGFTLQICNIQSSDQYSQIKHFFPDLECSSGSEIECENIKYLLNQEQLFNIIDKLNQLNSFGVKIQLVQNTLEAAYLKLNKDHLEENQLVKEMAFPMQQTHDTNVKVFLQISALLLKKFYVLKRNFTVQLMIVVPIAMLLLAYFIGYPLLEKDNVNFFVTLFITQSFSLNSSIFISTPILERELKIRQQLQQMGMGQGTYLFATFLGDYLVMLIMVLSIYIIQGGIDNFPITQSSLLSILSCFGLAIIAFSYCASFLFSSNQSAFKIFPVINFLVCYFIPLMIQQQIPELCEYLTYVFPLYTLNKAFENESLIEEYCQQFILQTAVYLLLYLIFEKASVLYENRKDGISSGMTLSVNDVSHSYNRPVLKHVDVQLPKSKVLTILGPNGAGKTTLIQLITDCLQLKHGKVMYKQDTIISSCQQQEGLWEDLTAEELVHVYAMIKGGNKFVRREVQQILRILNIKGKVVNMSGGQKRKAALAISLVGKSGIIVLDEPSNGLDPISRKNLQNMIKKHVELRSTSIILTTHDMEEAQYLSDSICFIINGQLPFPQETSQSLIEKYGSGILLTIKIRNEDALEQIKFAFPKHQREGLVILVKLGNEYDVVNILTILRTLHADNLIAAFTIKQANLEQVFLRQCKRQQNDD